MELWLLTNQITSSDLVLQASNLLPLCTLTQPQP